MANVRHAAVEGKSGSVGGVSLQNVLSFLAFHSVGGMQHACCAVQMPYPPSSLSCSDKASFSFGWVRLVSSAGSVAGLVAFFLKLCRLSDRL